MKTPKQAQREARQLFRLCIAGAALDERRVRLVMQRMLESPHTGDLAVLKHFQRLVARDCAEHSAEVTSAVPLPPPVRAEIEASLVRRYGRELVTSFVEDATLLGGVRVKAGSDVYDGSVKGGLAALARRF